MGIQMLVNSCCYDRQEFSLLLAVSPLPLFIFFSPFFSPQYCRHTFAHAITPPAWLIGFTIRLVTISPLLIVPLSAYWCIISGLFFSHDCRFSPVMPSRRYHDACVCAVIIVTASLPLLISQCSHTRAIHLFSAIFASPPLFAAAHLLFFQRRAVLSCFTSH